MQVQQSVHAIRSLSEVPELGVRVHFVQLPDRWQALALLEPAGIVASAPDQARAAELATAGLRIGLAHLLAAAVSDEELGATFDLFKHLRDAGLEEAVAFGNALSSMLRHLGNRP